VPAIPAALAAAARRRPVIVIAAAAAAIGAARLLGIGAQGTQAVPDAAADPADASQPLGGSGSVGSWTYPGNPSNGELGYPDITTDPGPAPGPVPDPGPAPVPDPVPPKPVPVQPPPTAPQWWPAGLGAPPASASGWVHVAPGGTYRRISAYGGATHSRPGAYTTRAGWTAYVTGPSFWPSGGAGFPAVTAYRVITGGFTGQTIIADPAVAFRPRR
jgi:hypothetical protein